MCKVKKVKCLFSLHIYYPLCAGSKESGFIRKRWVRDRNTLNRMLFRCQPLQAQPSPFSADGPAGPVTSTPEIWTLTEAFSNVLWFVSLQSELNLSIMIFNPRALGKYRLVNYDLRHQAILRQILWTHDNAFKNNNLKTHTGCVLCRNDTNPKLIIVKMSYRRICHFRSKNKSKRLVTLISSSLHLLVGILYGAH